MEGEKLKSPVRTRNPVAKWPNKLGAWVVPLLALGFIFDHRVSELMYLFGYDDNKISNIWFLRDQYDFLKASRTGIDLNADPFHVLELAVWLSLAISLSRLLMGLLFLSDPEPIRLYWRQTNITSFKFLVFWLIIVGGSLYAPSIGYKGASDTFHSILAYSPKAFLLLEAVWFFIGSILFVEGILVFFRLFFCKPHIELK